MRKIEETLRYPAQMPPGIRFRPPRVDSSPELRWVLLRSFAPPGAPPPPPVQGDRCLHLARRLALAPRIGARQSAELLAGEAGPAAAAGFHRDRVRTVAWNLRWRALAAELAAVAAELGLSLVFLKFMALELAGLLPEGGRAAADLDVLLRPAEGRRLAAALTARGYARSPLPEMEHQLPPLTAPAGGGVVEIHRLLPGVRLTPGGASATAPALQRAGLLVPAPGLPREARLPAREVLAAHALVHGLAQHGWAPHAYPALRLVGDLLDLGLGGGGPGDGGPAAPAGRFRDWVRPALSGAEVAAAEELCRRLAAGDLSDLDADPAAGGAAALLHHFLAGALEADYCNALRLRLAPAPSDRSPPAVFAAALLHALFPSGAELEAIYGPSRGPLGRLGLRLRRPVDVGLRALRYAAGARRLRRRR